MMMNRGYCKKGKNCLIIHFIFDICDMICRQLDNRHKLISGPFYISYQPVAQIRSGSRGGGGGGVDFFSGPPPASSRGSPEGWGNSNTFFSSKFQPQHFWLNFPDTE